MKRVAKFEKVSYEQFETAWKDSFSKPSMVTDKTIKDAYYPIELPQRATKGTYTTRPMRKEDVDGETYHFITEEQFNDMIEKDLFAEHASYNGWQYGTAKEDCTDDKVVVLTPHGLRQLKKNKDLHIISFYIDVPRRDRLIKILERGDDIEESYRRNLSDVGQFDGIKDEVDYVISNKGYSWSPLNMAHIIKRSMEWMKC